MGDESTTTPRFPEKAAEAFVYPAHVDGPVFRVIDIDLPEANAPAKRKPRHPTEREANRRAMAERRGSKVTRLTPATAPDTLEASPVTTSDDLAAVVVRQTLKGIAAGKLQPTLRDGIQAQQLLDRRAEKAADRTFMLNLASALAGGGHAVPQKLLPPPDDDLIEGEFTETALAPAHLRAE